MSNLTKIKINGRFPFQTMVFIIVMINGLMCQELNGGTNTDSLLRVVEQQKESLAKADNLLALTLHYKNNNRIDSAMIFCNMALALSGKLKYQEGVADALYRKSQIYDKTGDINAAIECAGQLLRVCDSMHYGERLAKGHYHMGNLLRNTSNKQSAIGHYKKSLPYYLQAKDTTGIYANYNSIGSFYFAIAKYDSAAVYYHQAINIYEAMGGEKNLGLLWGNLGKVYHMLGDFDNARKYLEQGFEYAEKSGNYRIMASTSTKLGNLESDLGSLDTALKHYRNAESYHQQNKNMDALGLSHLYNDYGVLYTQLGDYRLAMEYYDKALVYYREHDNTQGMIAVWQGKAYIYMKQQKYKDALAYLDSCRVKSSETGELLRQKEALESYVKIYYDTKDYRMAFDYLSQLFNLKDSLFNLDQTELVNDLLLRYEKEKDQARILALENTNLKRTKQRNAYLYTGISIIALSLFLVLYLRLTARKNRIIAEQRIRQLEEEKKLLAARFLVEGQEEERKRIATELHDGLGVLLSATKMQFTSIKDPSPENKPLIEKATKFLEQASSDVRKISHNMMPGLLTKLGLCEALEDLFEQLDESKGVTATCEIKGAKERLPENQEIMIYRIVQEMVNNTIKHAEATKIDLNINVLPDKLDIRYADNGKGFDVDEMLEKKSIGLQSILSRVKFLDGTVSIESAAGKGTVFAMQIPVNGEQ